MSLVSVIIPTYNRYKYLIRAINSVKNQSYKTVEIIVVNDCSTEKEYYKNKIEGITMINLQKNSRKIFGFPNVGYVRNQGIKVAKGEYIAFLDDDDYWIRPKIKMQIKAMKQNNLDFSNTQGYYCWDNKKRIHLRIFNYPKIWDYNFIKNANSIICSSVVVKKELLEKVGYFKEIFKPGGEDYELWKRCLKITNSIYVEEPLLYYDGNHGNGRNY